MTSDERKKIYELLSAPFPDEMVSRTYSDDRQVNGKTVKGTHKGYDTTGIGYQFVVNRLNEVLGVGGYRVTRKIKVTEGKTGTGKPCYTSSVEVTIALGEWGVENIFYPFAEAVGDGGHTSVTEADAIKGGFTNGFKKTAAMLGVGKQAYEGTLDDDNLPSEPAAAPRAQREPAAAKPEAIEDAAALIRRATTVDELAKLWQRWPNALRHAVKSVLDARKAQLQGGPSVSEENANDRDRRGSPPPASDGLPTTFPNFGKSKNQPIRGASLGDLNFYAESVQRSIDDPAKSRYVEMNQKMYDAIWNEIERQQGVT